MLRWAPMDCKRLIAAALCLLFATACDEKTPTAPTASLEREFTLAPGETAAVDGASLRVQFVRVSGDSRCPADAFCIQGGDALVHIRAESGGAAADYELHTGDATRSAALHAGLRIQLMNLQPYPFSSRTIPPDEYRATLKVSR